MVFDLMYLKGTFIRMPKFFVEESAVSESTVTLKDENMHHLINVLRKGKGDALTVCDSSGFDYECVIKEIGKDSVILEITDKFGSVSEPSVKITLYQGLPKGDKLSLIVEKSVEAGIFEIVPVSMARSVVKLSKKDFLKKKDRLIKVSISASKQSGRGIVPGVRDLLEFSEMIKELSDFDLVVFPYEEETETTLKSVIKGFEGEKIAVIIGPEGGFAPKEAEEIKSLGVSPVTLGKRILRTETAGIATVFNILYELEQ